MVRLWAAFLILCAAAGAAAQTDIYLRTERAGRGKVPIIVREIESASARERSAATLVAGVIRADLAYSGLFETLQSGAAGEEARAAGAVLEGKLSSAGSLFVLDAKLVDFSSKEVIFSKS